MAAVLGGLDGLVFTGGIGEHDALIRQRVGEDAALLRVRVDSKANQTAAGSGAKKISAQDSVAEVWMIPTNEESVIARHTAQLCGTGRHWK